MKGMQKIRRGMGFRGVVEYVLTGDGESKKEGRGIIIGGNMSCNNPKDLSREFGASRKLREDIEKPVWHNSLRLPVGEKIDHEKWSALADEYMQSMGFTDLHQRIYVLHDDEDGQHIHIVASRISLENKIYLGKNENLESTKQIHLLEKAYALKTTKGRDQFCYADQSKPSKGEIELAMRTGEPPARTVLQNIIDHATIDKPFFSEFIDRLKLAGVSVLPSGATGDFQGISFELNGVSFTGSKLGKHYAAGKIKSRIDYNQKRDQELVDDLRHYYIRGLLNDGSNEITESSGNGKRADTGDQGGRRADSDDQPGSNRFGLTPPISRGGSGKTGSSSVESRSDIDETRPIQDAGTTHTRSPITTDATSSGNNGRLNRAVYDAASNISSQSDAIKNRSEDRQNATNPDYRAKISAWERQSSALNAEKYRITLKARIEKDSIGRRMFDQNYGNSNNKKSQSIEKYHSREDVKNAIYYLRAKNAQGYDIYITPIDSSKHYIVVDDITPDKLEAMLNVGVEPSLIQQSSDNNKQAVIIINKESASNEQSLANNIVSRLNKKFGDKKFSGVIHPFRMAGFSNKKEERNNFITKIDYSEHKKCKITEGVMKKQRESDNAKNTSKHIEIDITENNTSNQYLIDLYKQEAQKQIALAERMKWELDLSKVDFAVAKALTRLGYSENLIAKAILEASFDLESRHKDIESYALKTAQNAIMSINQRAERVDEEDGDRFVM